MFYTIYKITNVINGKVYIGKHQTKNIDDSYMGSGKHLKWAQSKYGLDSFHKEILYVFETEYEMNAKEAELVTEEFCIRNDTYNICVGGQGGFSYINRTGLRTIGHTAETNRKRSKTLSRRSPSPKRIEAVKKAHADGKYKYSNTKGKNISEDHKMKISVANSKMVGDKNSQYGSFWITDGSKNKKVRSPSEMPDGWYKGRTTMRSAN